MDTLSFSLHFFQPVDRIFFFFFLLQCHMLDETRSDVYCTMRIVHV